MQPSPIPQAPEVQVRERLIGLISDRSFNPLLLSPLEIYHCACLLFECAMEGLHIPPYVGDRVKSFLRTLQCFYPDNPYHNFFHAVDVLQSFYLMLSPEILPPVQFLLLDPLQRTWRPHLPPGHPLSSLLPVEVLGLLLAAVGHDVGHPGVTAVFLENVGAPLTVIAPVSPLETLHFKLLSQLLKSHGLSQVLDNSSSEELMGACILATDMKFHRRFMEAFGNSFNPSIVALSAPPRLLVCQALIKAADICNPARPFQAGVAWSSLVMEEWSRQGRLEESLGVPITQKIAPLPGTTAYDVEQATGQLGFMDACTIPLFEVVSGLLRGPKMSSFVAACYANRAVWVHRVAVATSQTLH